MANVDGTFKSNFTLDGELKLKEKVMEKLKEMGVDSLEHVHVKYVIMLLRNGKRKEEARNQLNHILGDQSGSFVCWLWEHLTKNINLYLQSKDLEDDESPTITKVQAGGHNNQHLTSESKRGTYHSRHRNQGWKELVVLVRSTDPPPLLWSEVFGINLAEQSRTRTTRDDNSGPRSRSRSASSLKRNRVAVFGNLEGESKTRVNYRGSSLANRIMNKGHLSKRKRKSDAAISQGTVMNPTKRLFQGAISAMRDAVKSTSKPSSSGTPLQPPSNRFRQQIQK